MHNAGEPTIPLFELINARIVQETAEVQFELVREVLMHLQRLYRRMQSELAYRRVQKRRFGRVQTGQLHCL
jgi:hypothetical protein